MEEIDGNRIRELMEELCKIPSVSGDAKEENLCAQFIYDYLSYLKPVAPATLTVKLIPCDKDDLGRNAVLALYRTAEKTDRTILLTGHFDVVSAEVYGKLKDVAFEPEICTEEIHELSLSKAVKKDLESGNWLFGRGTMDMKCGLAMFMLAIKVASQEKDFPANLLFLAVPDEESNSAGMRGALPAFVKFIEDEKLDVVAALSGEPCFVWTNSQGEEVRPYWTGTIGKIMPFVLSLGKESHINDYYEGFNASLLCSWTVEALEGDRYFLSVDQQYNLPPPTCLYMATLRKEYSVTLPSKAVAYFNVLTANATPQEVLDKVRERLKAKVTQAINEENSKGRPVPLPLPKFYLYSDIVHKARHSFNNEKEYEKSLADFQKSIKEERDERQRGILEASWQWDRSGLSGPAMVIGVLPPYYPPRINRMKTENEKLLRKVIEEEAAIGEKLAELGKTEVIDVFAGITDMSFLGFEGDEKDLVALKDNMPGWGTLFWLPIDELKKIDIPVANMGPSGKDAHKATERLELGYSLKVAPRLLRETLWKLGEPEKAEPENETL